MGMTTQQQLVIDQCKRNYDDLNRTGEHLDHKAMLVIVASILLFGASSGVFVPLAFCVAAIGAAIGALAPREHKRVGDGDWDTFFNLYISVEADDAINQVLSNLGNAITVNAASNEDKARIVNLSMLMLLLQVLSTLIVAAF